MEQGNADPSNPGLQRTQYQLRAGGVRGQPTNPLRSGIHSRGYLPHVKREGACYFVTFRLADSLPKEKLLQFEQEKAEQLRGLEKIHGQAQKHLAEQIHRDFRRKVERYLDTGAGSCHLGRPEIAELVAGALAHFGQARYVLDDWVIMPNHVHAVVWPMPNHLLGGILGSWKQFTSRRARKILKLTDESFWQPESYDHWIRDDEEKARIRAYIRNNPVKARLCKRPEDWRWSSVEKSGNDFVPVEK